MKIKQIYLFRILTLIVTVCMLWGLQGCATSYAVNDQEEIPFASLSTPLPEYNGPKEIVAVIPLGLSERAAKNYPHLLEKSVGMGIHNIAVEALYDTGRFRFVEDNAEIIKNVMDRQWMSSAGMLDQDVAIQLGKMLGARKIIYGEVYDYAEGGEKISGFTAREKINTRVGVQVRYVDIETLEYIPGSGIGKGPDVGAAAGKAISNAVVSMIRRMK